MREIDSMEKTLFFKDTCPKCKKHGIFNILNVGSENSSKYAESFVSDEWRQYDYELFSINSACKICKHFVCGSVAVIWDEEKNSSAALSDFASEEGEILQNANLFIEFDVPPLIPQQHLSSPPTVDINYLYQQAERCYDIHAWDAVVILCRKVVDIQSAKMWRQMFGAKPIPVLYERVLKILSDGKLFDKNEPIEDQLDYSNKKHKLLHDIEQIRKLGNFAAHNEICVGSDDAEGAMIYTKTFINTYYKYNEQSSKT